MKVRCIDNNWVEEDLTVNKIYEAVDRGTSGYELTDDAGEIWNWRKCHFEIVEDETNVETVSTGKMIDMLAENPKRIATDGDCKIYWHNENLYMGDVKWFVDMFDTKRRWTIIEPVEKISFAEAFKAYRKTSTIIKSCVTGKKFGTILTRATDEEIDGEWEIVEV